MGPYNRDIISLRKKGKTGTGKVCDGLQILQKWLEEGSVRASLGQ